MVRATHFFKEYLDQLAIRWSMTKSELLFAFFLVFSFLSGVQAHLLPSVYPLTKDITDVLLLVVCGPLLWFIHQRHQDARFWWWWGLTYLSTFFIEVAGVATGSIFGEYAYGPTMWIQWLNVPLVIALNWTLLILAMHQIASYIVPKSSLLTALLTGVLIMAYDFCIEPVAIALDYWTWEAVDIPLQNYLAWGGIAFLFSWPLSHFEIAYRHPLLIVYGVAQLAFFLLLQALFIAS